MNKFKPWGIILISIVIVLLLFDAFYGFISGCIPTGYWWVCGPTAFIGSIISLIGAIYFILILIKSNLRKIILLVILFLVSNVIKYIPFKDCWIGKGNYTAHCDWKLCQPSFFLCQHTEANQYYLGIRNPFLQMILIVFFMFVFPYLLSSLIIWLYDKFKKKPH